jgi:hypothetical protein
MKMKIEAKQRLGLIATHVTAAVYGDVSGKFIEGVFRSFGVKCKCVGATLSGGREELEFTLTSPYVLSDRMMVYQDAGEPRDQFFFEVGIMNVHELFDRATLQTDAFELDGDGRVSSVDVNDFAVSVRTDSNETLKYMNKHLPAWSEFVSNFDKAVAKIESVAAKELRKSANKSAKK